MSGAAPARATGRFTHHTDPAPPTPGDAGWERAGTLPHEDAAALLRTVGRLWQVAARPAEQGRLLQTIVDEAAGLARGSAALLAPEPDDASILRLQLGSGALTGLEGELFPVEGSFVGAAFVAGTHQLSPDLSADRRTYLSGRRGGFLGPACALPLTSGNRRFGVLLVVREPFAGRFEPEDLDLLAAAGAAFAAALANAARFQESRGDRGAIEEWRRLQRLSVWQDAYEASCRADRRVVLRWNTDRATFEWGATLPDLLGVPAAGFGTTLDEWLPYVAEADRERVRAVLEEGRRGWEEISLDFGASHASGAFRRLHLNVLPPDPDAGLRYGTLADVTSTARRGPATGAKPGDGAAPAAVAGSRRDHVSEIVRMLRHEINNPLAAVLGQLQLLEHEPAVVANAGLREALQVMYREGRRIDTLVQHLAALEHHPRRDLTADAQGGAGTLPTDP